jgi:hypothetical protein
MDEFSVSEIVSHDVAHISYHSAFQFYSNTAHGAIIEGLRRAED